MRTRTTLKSFAFTLTLLAALSTPLLAAGRDDAKRDVRQHREPTTVMQRLANIIHQIFGDDAIVPKPAPPSNT